MIPTLPFPLLPSSLVEGPRSRRPLLPPHSCARIATMLMLRAYNALHATYCTVVQYSSTPAFPKAIQQCISRGRSPSFLFLPTFHHM